MGSLGPMELIIIAVIALLVFGPKKLPELGSGLGKAIKDFKSAMSETTEQITKPEPQAKEEKKEDKKDEKKEETTTKTS